MVISERAVNREVQDDDAAAGENFREITPAPAVPFVAAPNQRQPRHHPQGDPPQFADPAVLEGILQEKRRGDDNEGNGHQADPAPSDDQLEAFRGWGLARDLLQHRHRNRNRNGRRFRRSRLGDFDRARRGRRFRFHRLRRRCRNRSRNWFRYRCGRLGGFDRPWRGRERCIQQRDPPLQVARRRNGALDRVWRRRKRRFQPREPSLQMADPAGAHDSDDRQRYQAAEDNQRK